MAVYVSSQGNQSEHLLHQDGDDEVQGQFLRSLIFGFVILTFSIFVSLLNFGLIMYDGVVAEVHRTLISKMLSVSSAYNILYMCFIMPLGLALVVVGIESGPPAVCSLLQFLFLTIVCLVFLGHNEVILLRYFYACRLNTMASIREGLWLTFLVCLNAIISTFVGFCLACLFLEEFFIYQICSRSLSYGNDKYSHGELVPATWTLLTLVNHTMVDWKIRRKQKNAVLPYQPDGPKQEGSIMNFKTAIVLMIVSLVMSCINLVSSQFKFQGPLRTVPLVRAPFIFIVIVVIPLSIYVGKPKVRKAVFKEFKGKIWPY